MPARVETRTFDAFLTTTFAEYEKKLQDQIFDDVPLLSYMNGKLGRAIRGTGTIKITLGGGERITVPLLYGTNTTAGSYAGGEQLSTNIQDGITNGFFDWSQYSVSIAITGLQKRGNMGTYRILNLLQSKTIQAELSIQERLNQNLWAAASATTGNAGKDVISIPSLVDDTVTIGGINPSTNTWWASTVNTVGGDFLTNDVGLIQMRNTFNTVTIGNKSPDIGFMPQNLYEDYEQYGQDDRRHVSNKLLDLGFRTLEFKGIPLVYDRDMPVGEIYFLNGLYIHWYVHRDADLNMTPQGFQTPIGQDTSVAMILLQAQATISNRRRVGKNTGITT